MLLKISIYQGVLYIKETRWDLGWCRHFQTWFIQYTSSWNWEFNSVIVILFHPSTAKFIFQYLSGYVWFTTMFENHQVLLLSNDFHGFGSDYLLKLKRLKRWWIDRWPSAIHRASFDGLAFLMSLLKVMRHDFDIIVELGMMILQCICWLS